jgi:asparagine synthase (glutamine-hydrolysing)
VSSELVELPPQFRPRPLEIACGLALGVDDQSDALLVRGAPPARSVLEAAVRQALVRPPCLVSFSGGRDSSAVLAMATAVARRDGLAPPIPITYRFAAAPGSREDEWQEQVVRHLGLREWERLPMNAELDAVGPVAQAVLRRHGVLWPFNAHFHQPLLDRASGGSLLTGIGGDELFARQLWSSARCLLGGRAGRSAEGDRSGGRPKVRARSVALAVAPVPVRRWAVARRRRLHFPWLRPGAAATVHRNLDDWRARTPIAWPAALGWWWRSRHRTMLTATMAMLATAAGTEIVHPFLDRRVVAAVAWQFGRSGPGDRSSAMRVLFADLLPEALLTRRSKAHFDEAFVSEYSRDFGSGWTGAGVDSALVDAERLAAEWRSERPDARSLLLMQAAWLSSPQ